MSTLSVRRPLSVLAVLAMIATMLFAVVGTASAADAPDFEATFSACPANAGIPDAGFTDVPAGSFFDDGVNCLAYYGVTKGTTATTYSPGDDVTRAQMALFLARSAAAAGVVLKASPPDAGFTDIGGLSAEAQLAINQLADAGIVKGKTATTYGPAQTVWRQQMALFLTRFLGKAVVGPGGNALGTAATSGSPFTDLGNTTVEASKAINQAWDLGIAAGTTTTTFDPLGNVNRGQMSSFLTRLYAQANTRPAGVNLQAEPVTGFGTFASSVSVTVRGTDFSPSANTEVDVWRFDPSTTVTSPFNANGTCNIASTLISQLQSGGTECTLDLIDPSMDLNGNWPVFTENALDGATSSFYAWTGAVGSTFDNDTTVSSTVTIGSAKDATDATFTIDVPKNAFFATAISASAPAPETANVTFGTTVKFTVQLMDGTGTTAKPVAKSGVSYTFRDVKTVNSSAAGTTYSTIKTDAMGKAVYTVTESDPNPAPIDDWISHDVLISGTDGPAVFNSFQVWWSDGDPYVTTVVAATATDYKVQSDGASNTVTATVYDQYGMTMAGVQVGFTSTDNADDAAGVGITPIMRTTNAAGDAILGYTWKHSAPATDVTAKETIKADAGLFVVDSTEFYWVNKAATGDNGVMANEVDDVDNDSVVGNDGTDYLLFVWDGNDQFNDNSIPITQKAFETAIKNGDDFFVTYEADSANVSIWNLPPPPS